MRCNVCYSALGLALVFGASAAHAQMITTQPAPAVVTTSGAALLPPAETTRTTRTVRTVRTYVPVRRQIVTTRTVTSRILPAETAAPVVAETAAIRQPLYNVAPVAVPAADFYPAPSYDYGYRAPLYDYAYRAPAYDYAPPLYNVAPTPIAPAVAAPAPVAAAPIVTAPAVAAPVVAAPLATQPVIYRYVYEPDRILVIDPATGIAVQAIPR